MPGVGWMKLSRAGSGLRPRWEAAEPPSRPRRRPGITEVDDAYLTEVAVGRTASSHAPRQWFRGAVHDHEGRLVEASQKWLGDRRGPRVAVDPATVTRSEERDELAGTWLYGGTWANVYGHFLVETLTTLWPTLPERPSGLVFHSNFGQHEVADWHRRFIELAGFGDLPIHVVGLRRPARAERLVVPGRSVSLHAWAHPEARATWERVAQDFRGEGDERVYVSRTRLNQRRRRQGHHRPIRTTREQDQALDAVFRDHGFTVLHPETMSVDDQLRAVGSARVIAGLSGSGLHQSAFLPAGGRVLEVGDSRTSTTPVRMQRAIDAAMEHERCFVPGDTTLPELGRTLTRLGLV